MADLTDTTDIRETGRVKYAAAATAASAEVFGAVQFGHETALSRRSRW